MPTPFAVVDLRTAGGQGLIPVGYAPSSVVLDSTDGVLLVANDKGIGTTGYGVAPLRRIRSKIRTQKNSACTDFNTHQDLGTVSIVPVPSLDPAAMTNAGLPEQPLGSVGKYRICRRWQPVDRAGRDPGQDRRSLADQARLPDHP
jgi:hypothetical protein